ncbi:MAG: hypothetical protein M3Y04_06930 [Actinomycetota bacterium]|nr:hypothetical protein [Actinomycetota bacterium]
MPVRAELAAAENPFSILTKSTLILRDLNLLAKCPRRAFGAPDPDRSATVRARPPAPAVELHQLEFGL